MDIRAYHVTSDKINLLKVDASSLDGMTGQLAQGLYTTFSTLAQGTKVLGLQSHLQRLYGPAKELGLHAPVDETVLRQRIAELVKQNLPHESRVRLILTKDKGELYIGIQSFEPLPQAVYMNGVKVISTQAVRRDPRIKDTGFISSSTEQRKLLSKDVFEILLTKDGKILEGMTSNFYAVKGRTLITARLGILLGVTRKAVLRIARGQGMSIEYRPTMLNEKINEAFLTSSSRGVVPIVSIDGTQVGEGDVGKWSKLVLKAYRVFVEERSEPFV